MTTRAKRGAMVGVGLAMTGAMLGVVPTSTTVSSPDDPASTQVDGHHEDVTAQGRFTRTVRLVKGGQTQVTVIRDSTGDVVARAITNPGAVVEVHDADGPMEGRSGEAPAAQGTDDGDAVWASVQTGSVTQTD